MELAPEFHKLRTHRELIPPAMITAMLYNINRRKGAPAKSPEDVLKKLPKPKLPETPTISEDVARGLALFCQLLEGVIQNDRR